MSKRLTRREAILAGTLAFAGVASAAGRRKSKRTSAPPKPTEPPVRQSPAQGNFPRGKQPRQVLPANLPRELDESEFGGLKTKLKEWRRDMAVPGVALVGIREGQIDWRFDLGMAVSGVREVNPLTRWQAASLTKPMFAYVVLKLCEEGKLALDMPLRRQYLDYASFPPSRTPGAEFITPRMVLAHETGLPLTHSPNFPEELDFAPGSQFGYSGAAYIYLQKVVERIAGQSLETLMGQRVFEPMDLQHSTLVWPASYDQDMAAGYELNGRPCPDAVKPIEPNAAGSLHTTALDYAAFMCQAFLNRQDSALHLSPTYERMMFSPQVPLNGSNALAWGLGWCLRFDRGNRDEFLHFGTSRGLESYAVGRLSDGTAMVGFTNKRGGLRLLALAAREILGASQDEVFRWIYAEFYKGDQGGWPLSK